MAERLVGRHPGRAGPDRVGARGWGSLRWIDRWIDNGPGFPRGRCLLQVMAVVLGRIRPRRGMRGAWA